MSRTTGTRCSPWVKKATVKPGKVSARPEHPLRALRAAGVRVTLGSDDPPWFGASIGGEYAICAERLGLGDQDLRELTRTALEAAFCEEKLKENLINALR